MVQTSAYLAATRHPWACLLFVLPLLVAYEVGVLLMDLDQPEALRNGADVWLRWLLSSVGLRHLLWAPGILLLILLIWTFLKANRQPRDFFGVWLGMTVESALFALALWGCCHLMLPVLSLLAVAQPQNPNLPDPAIQQLVCFAGAGIYEETLFRLVLFSGLRWLLLRVDLPWPGAGVIAGVVSALLFSAAHNIGPYGEDFQAFVFIFRTVAGLYFVALFQMRGFGIAVGAHTGYDILVGLLDGFR